MKLLWQALEDSPRLVGVRQELLHSLGDEYPIAAHFLSPNGKEARRYPCPSPGDPGCPRRIVKDSGGWFRAVCAAESQECDSLRLPREEIQVLAFDSGRFARALQEILGLPAGSPQIKHRGDIVYLGTVRATSGQRVPVILVMASSGSIAKALIADIERSYRHGAVILTPTEHLIDRETENRLVDSGFTWLVLANILLANRTKLSAKQPLTELVGQPNAVTRRSALRDTAYRFPTPPDTEWKDVQIRFTDGNTVTIKVGDVAKRVTYAEINMKQANSGQPTVLWRLLQDFAGNDGRFDWHHPQASRQIKQRVCRLRKTLKVYFGLTADPFFRYQRGVGYKVRFQLDPEQ